MSVDSDGKTSTDGIQTALGKFFSHKRPGATVADPGLLVRIQQIVEDLNKIKRLLSLAVAII